jgi:CheY-like chemotaxis protein
MSKNILIIEDDPSFAEFLEVTVRAAGHLPHVAVDGASGLRLFESIRPDLVFLDLLIPKRDGFAVCEEMRSTEEGRRVPVVVVTGIYKKQEYRKSVEERFGVTDFLVKPVQIVDLWRVLDKYLEPKEGEGLEGADETIPEPARSEVAADDLFQGEPVRDTPLVAHLHALNEERKTGLLFLKDSGRVTILFLEKGSVVFARSSDPRHRLSRLLAQEGLVSRAELREAEELLRKGPGGVRMGELLVGMKSLSKEQLETTVRQQLQAILAEAFRSESWSAHFVEGELPSDEPIRLKDDTLKLILQGVREIPSSETVQRHLPPSSTILALTPDAPRLLQRLQLTPYEQKMLALFDGARTLRKVLSIGRLGPVDMERLTLAFLHAGLVERVGGPEAPVERLKAPTDRLPAPSSDVEAPTTGNLRNVPLACLLMDLHRGARSGVLELERGKEKAWLYLDGGRIVFAGSNDPGSRLGEVLVEGRLVSPEDLARVVEATEDDGKEVRIGQKLVDQALLTLEELSWAMTFQMQRRVQELFGWMDGRFTFREEPFPTDETITMDFNTPDVVLEGVRRMEPASVASQLPNGEQQITRAGNWADLRAGLKLTPAEERLLARFDHRMTVDSVLARADFEPQFLYRSLMAFLHLGLVEVQHAEEGPPPEAPCSMAVDAAVATVDRGNDGRSEPAAAGGPEAESVPRFLFDQNVSQREELQSQMFDVYREVEALHRCISELRTEIRTLRQSSLLERVDAGVRESLDSIFDSFLDRVQGLGR